MLTIFNSIFIACSIACTRVGSASGHKMFSTKYNVWPSLTPKHTLLSDIMHSHSLYLKCIHSSLWNISAIKLSLLSLFWHNGLPDYKIEHWPYILLFIINLSALSYHKSVEFAIYK